MKKHFSRIIILAVLISMVTIRHAGAWYSSDMNPYGGYYDVHEDDTERWCMDKGMSTFWSDQTANACKAVDVLFLGNYRWHLDRSRFTGEAEDTRILQSKNEMIITKRRLDEAAGYTAAYNKSTSRLERLKLYSLIKKAKLEAVIYLGRSLHPVQDMYAHMDAGVDTPDSELGISHGMLNAEPVEVKVFYPEGNYEIREMKLETKDPEGRIYSMYDDLNYDYVEGQWIFRQDTKKEENTRWLNTRNASYMLLDEFINYADKLGVSFKI